MRLIFPGALVLLLFCAPAALAQYEVFEEDEQFRYKFRIDQLEYGRIDTIHVSYSITNKTPQALELPMCCCGVEFFAVRDSSCWLGEENCQVAGCDACDVCWDDDPCQNDECTPIPIGPGETRELFWNWDTEVCPRDIGFDGQFGNIGWFRVIAGWHHCDVPGLTNMMSAQIYIATRVPVRPMTWGGIKVLYGREDPPPAQNGPASPGSP